MIPFYDFFAAPLLGLLFIILLFLQWEFPLRVWRFNFLTHFFRNVFFALPALLAMRLVLLPIPLAATIWTKENNIGVLYALPGLPNWLAGVLGILILDYAYFWWHRAMHYIPLLWRLHNVHHTDLDLDVSTAARFHVIEVLISLFFRLAVVIAFGIGFWTYLIFEFIFEAATQFHHSNWRLPQSVDRVLSFVVITPRLHGIHHSIVKDETNSNWGTIFSWWDRLHRTRRMDIPQDEIIIGVPAYRDEDELTVGDLWKMPFQPLREWRLPDGERPEQRESNR